MVPMTKEEYERQQSKVRRVFDPETGRNRYCMPSEMRVYITSTFL